MKRLLSLFVVLIFALPVRADIIEDVYNAWSAYNSAKSSYNAVNNEFVSTVNAYNILVSYMDEGTAYTVSGYLTDESNYLSKSLGYINDCTTIGSWISWAGDGYNNSTSPEETAYYESILSGLCSSMQSGCSQVNTYSSSATEQNILVNLAISNWQNK